MNAPICHATKCLFCFSTNLLVLYHECRPLIGYAPHYISCDSDQSCSVPLLTKWRPLLVVCALVNYHTIEILSF